MPVDPLTLRLEKGTPLTAQEGDDNFKKLRDFSNGQEQLLSTSINPDGTLKNPPSYYAASATGTSQYAITLSPVPASLTDLIGKLIAVKSDVDSVADPAPTLNVNGLGAIPIGKGYQTTLDKNDIRSGYVFVVVYNGAIFNLVSFPATTGPMNYGNAGGTSNAIQVTSPSTVNIPKLMTEGYGLFFKVASSNTSAVTLQIGTLTAKKLMVLTPIGTMRDLTAGELIAGDIVAAVYSGTADSGAGAFMLVRANGGDGSIRVTPFALSASNARTLISHNLARAPRNVRVAMLNISAEGGWTNGQEIDPNMVFSANGPIVRFGADASLIYVFHFYPGGSYWVENVAGDGTLTALTAAKWNIVVYYS